MIFLKKSISGFATDRSKKYIKIIEIDMKIDAVAPQAAADNPPPPPGNKAAASMKEPRFSERKLRV